MTHLPFIAAAYGLGVMLPLGFAIDAFRRMAAAKRKLAAIDPRRNHDIQHRGAA